MRKSVTDIAKQLGCTTADLGAATARIFLKKKKILSVTKAREWLQHGENIAAVREELKKII